MVKINTITCSFYITLLLVSKNLIEMKELYTSKHVKLTKIL